ncbi:hypothetical protein D7X33_07035 [Butyricicoccus sp. 1XD8-22]|nr:hypothetical protein D7X33_07035 [Butyricicoccus sp. 1XD8-22]
MDDKAAFVSFSLIVPSRRQDCKTNKPPLWHQPMLPRGAGTVRMGSTAAHGLCICTKSTGRCDTAAAALSPSPRAKFAAGAAQNGAVRQIPSGALAGGMLQ